MSAEFLEASLQNQQIKASHIIGLNIPFDWFEEKDIMRIRLGNYQEDAEYIPWGLRAIGLRENNEMVGFIGFHTIPNPDYLQEFAANAIELGYTIFLSHRRQGFVQEAIIGLVNWATKQHPIETLIASVSPTNIASTELVRKLKFDKISEQIDDVDGIEFVYSIKTNKLASL